MLMGPANSPVLKDIGSLPSPGITQPDLAPVPKMAVGCQNWLSDP